MVFLIPSLQTLKHRLSINLFNIWIVLFDCPSDGGWNVVLKFNVVPRARWIFGYNYDVNLGSQSKTIDNGIPYSHTTTSIYSFANLSIKFVIFIGRKKVDLVNQLTMTQITSFPFLPLSSSDTKSMVIFSHFHSGIKSGCRGAAGF